MSGIAVVIIIVVVWLFVLAPWLLRGQKPIRKTGEALSEGRVVYQGGSGKVPSRPKPRVKPGDVHRGHADEEYDLEVVEAEATIPMESSKHSAKRAEDVQEQEIELLEEESTATKKTFSLTTLKGKWLHKQVQDNDNTEEEIIDVEAQELDDVQSLEEEPANQDVEVPVVDAFNDDEDDVYVMDESYVDPTDMLYDDGEEETSQPARLVRDADERAMSEQDSQLTDEDIEFAQRRRGRGGWDPEAEELARADRYRRRQMTLGLLAGLLTLGMILAIIFGGWWWALSAAFAGILALYLYALRQQVQAEKRLHRRRVMQLRRARLGVRNEKDEALGIPERLRHPGAVVLEIDDESPDFVNLEEIVVPVGYDNSYPDIEDQRGSYDVVPESKRYAG